MAMAMTMAMYKPIKGQEEEDNGHRNKSLKSNDEDGVGGDHTIVDESKSFILPTHSKQQHHQQRLKQQQQRLVSLDVFRGLTVALMILVDDAGGVLPAINHSPWNGLTLADVVMPFFLFMVGASLGLTYKISNDALPDAATSSISTTTDALIPNPIYILFLQKLPSKAVATRKAILRALKLLVIGLFLQGYSGKDTIMWFLKICHLSFPGGFLHGLNDLTFGVDMVQIRWMGILQLLTVKSVAAFPPKRIAIGYLIGAMCEIWLKGDNHVASGLSMLRKYQLQWGAVVVLVSLYLSLLYGLYVPDWEYEIPVAASSSSPKTFRVKCGVRGTTGSACNAVGMIDRTVLGIQHLYRKPIYARTKACSINSPDYGPLPPDAPSWCQAPFDPEGLLSSVMAIVTCLVGLHYGHIIVHFKEHKDRILHWMIPSTCFVVLGLVLDLSGMHVNKALYTFSYMCVTAGAAGIVFTGIYLLVDVCGFRRPTLVLEWMGMHALMIFILATSNVLPVVMQGFYWKQPGNNIVIFPLLCSSSVDWNWKMKDNRLDGLHLYHTSLLSSALTPEKLHHNIVHLRLAVVNSDRECQHKCYKMGTLRS
ncbi:hypothetical protein POTOM_014210 [Populus tomentosa]|uniref:Heparan-alpha-glucosaminide N-acetyltransferase catalytic domain-containing protein n=1 Tax=Populus tomentosa TaxID=118781 RepID=A0A8X8A6C9_POPTO|nr:hypothetical protein POTOM_014210 [Populus tomentosa]